jgi:hypothetical protein
MYSVYLSEVYGDAHQTQCLERKHGLLISKAIAGANIKEIRDAPISTKHIKEEFNHINDEDNVKFGVFEK